MAQEPSARVTLSDVAERAGVARSTVSYILRRVEPYYSRYAKQTIARVEQVAAETGYVPSLMARALSSRQLPYFGVFFEAVRPGDTGPNGGQPIMMWQVYEGIASTARTYRRYPVVLTSPDPGAGLADSPEELDRIVRSGLSGVIAAVHPETWAAHLARWDASGVPCISLFDRGQVDQPRWYVDLDNRAVGRLAWEYLARHGHQRVLCVYQEGLSRAVADRIAGFTEAHAGSDGDGDGAKRVLELTWSKDGVCRVVGAEQDMFLTIMRELKATAVFACDGGASVICYQVLVDHGVAIPRECALVGIDMPVWSPASRVVTQVECPGARIGQEAARLLEGRIRGRSAERRQVLVQPVLREGASVARL